MFRPACPGPSSQTRLPTRPATTPAKGVAPTADTESVDFALAAVVLAPGLALGSFLNVVAARVPLRRSIVRPPSACMSCGQEIRRLDNVPLLSYALLRGRCRQCQARIPLVYPAVELITALLLAGCVLAFGLTAKA